MPLITCPDCRQEVSDAAPACPQCGRPAVESLAPAAKVEITQGQVAEFLKGQKAQATSAQFENLQHLDRIGTQAFVWVFIGIVIFTVSIFF